HVGDRAVSQRRSGRPFAALFVVREAADRLQLLPQPTLPEVSVERRATLARGTAGGPLARGVLPRGVHLARTDQGHRPHLQGDHLCFVIRYRRASCTRIRPTQTSSAILSTHPQSRTVLSSTAPSPLHT